MDPGPNSARWMLIFVVLTCILPSSLAASCLYKRLWPSARGDGIILSPNYPEKYPPNVCIMWVYDGEPGNAVTLRIVYLDIPTSHDMCDHDSLMVGPIDKHRYCGSTRTQLFDDYSVELTSSQHTLYIVFNSTGVGPKGRGFNITYDFVGSQSTQVISTTTRRPTSTTLPYTDIPNSLCHTVLTRRMGVIRVVNEKSYCPQGKTWLLYFPHVSERVAKIIINFRACDLLEGDHLYIFDGRTEHSRLIAEMNSYTYTDNLQSSGNGLFIKYTTQHDTGATPNLEMSYMIEVRGQAPTSPPTTTMFNTPKAVDSAHVYKGSQHCQVVIDTQEGEISSEDVGKGCLTFTWKLYYSSIMAHGKSHYIITFDKLVISSRSKLRILDGPDESSPLLTTFFQGTYATELRSSKNAIIIQLMPAMGFSGLDERNEFTIRYQLRVQCDLNYVPCEYGEMSCYQSRGRCDGTWDCPLHGGDERNCHESCPSEFSCYTRIPRCYTEKDRCNGRAKCSNFRDEIGCTAAQCSSDKGLYLCHSGRCIFEKWRCDRTKDCADNSDEENCSWDSSPRVIVAAVVGSLACSLLLVIALGCVCKVYRHRVHQMRGGPRQETPLSRQLAEMFHRRAPPPPYHEAMLTSRPYDEAYLELLNQNDNNADSTSDETSAGATSASPDGRVHAGGRRSRRGRHSHHRGINQGVHFSPRVRSESQGLIDVGTLPLLPELVEEGERLAVATQSDTAGHRGPPPYCETDPFHGADTLGDSGDDSSDDGGDPDFHPSGEDRESLIQMELITPAMRNPVEQSSTSTITHQRNSHDLLTAADDEDGEESDKDAETVSTNLSVDSSTEPAQSAEDTGGKLQENSMAAIDEDSDSDCILGEEGGGDCDEGDSASDSELLLNHA